MATLHDSLLSSSARKLPLRKRADLSARRHQYLGRTYWVVKEPLGLNYFRFQEEEFAILQMLDGNVSLDELKERFEAMFPPQKISLEELQQFLGMLHRSGLIVADAPGQGYQLRKRRSERRRQEWINKWTNLLAIRFRGVDPERVLNWLYPKLRWCFSAPVLIGGLLLALSALLLVMVEFDAFRRKLPAFHDFFTLQNALWMAVVLAVSKIIHEFGHGLACKHFGGECHEMGVMILVLTPCLYCNVSDSWMLPSKWHRAAIGAAGIFVEVVLAAAATYVWWFTQPGFVHFMALNVMFVCSVSTIVFNGNPLLRYDGYYVLADLVEIPNLRQKATTLLSNKLAEWLLGIEPPEDPFLPQRRQLFFVLYSVAAAAYRWLVLASILWFLYQFFKPYGLQVIGWTIIGVSLIGLVGMPLYKVAKFFYVPGRLEKVKKPRMYISLALIGLLLAAVLLVPLPHSIICTLEIQPRDATPVYVDNVDGGLLAECYVRQGDEVQAGQLLAQLSNVELELKIVQLSGERERFKARLDTRRRQGEAGRGEVAQLEKALRNVEEQLEKRLQDWRRLQLTAPASGTVLPPPETPAHPDPEGQLPAWSGTPLDPENIGAYLEEGTLLCQIGDPTRYEAILVIDEADVDLIRAMLARGQYPDVHIKVYALPERTFRTQLLSVSNVDLKIAPRRLGARAGGELPTKPDPVLNVERPLRRSYQAQAPLDDPDGVLRLGLRGSARVYTAWMPLGKRLWRLIWHTVNFRM